MPDQSVSDATCAICEQILGPHADCQNLWCGRHDRYFSLVWSISPFAGVVRRAIVRYKYRGEREWGPVLARLVVGFLDECMPWFDGYDVIVPMPAYRGRGARRSWDPIGVVASAASALAGDRWPLATGAVVKRFETVPFAGLGLGRRRTLAEGDLRRALWVTDPGPFRGARILVLDDVFTEGSTLREVARSLLAAGAVDVAGLAVARQHWVNAKGSPRAGPHGSGDGHA